MRTAVRLTLTSVLLLQLPACDKGDAQGDPNPSAADPAASASAKADAGEAKQAPERQRTYGAELCELIIPCYEQHKFDGNFSADVAIDIEPDGSISAVSFTGEAPKPIEACISDTIKANTVSDYNGKPGRTRCKKSGQLSGGMQMVMSDVGYEERDVVAKAPQADDDAEDED